MAETELANGLAWCAGLRQILHRHRAELVTLQSLFGIKNGRDQHQFICPRLGNKIADLRLYGVQGANRLALANRFNHLSLSGRQARFKPLDGSWHWTRRTPPEIDERLE